MTQRTRAAAAPEPPTIAVTAADEQNALLLDSLWHLCRNAESAVSQGGLEEWGRLPAEAALWARGRLLVMIDAAPDGVRLAYDLLVRGQRLPADAEDHFAGDFAPRPVG